MRTGFHYSASRSLEDARFIGENCEDAAEWMQLNCPPEEVLRFLVEAFHQDDIEEDTHLESVLVTIIKHDIWWVVIDFLECLRDDLWFGPIIYVDQLAHDGEDEDNEEVE